MTKLKGFISYAHADEDYFKLAKMVCSKHGKHSRFIGSDFWHDDKILAGSLVAGIHPGAGSDGDFAVFLDSSNFVPFRLYRRTRVQKFPAKRQDEDGFLFFPLLVAPCDFARWEQLVARQFFKPNGREYDCPEAASMMRL
ncbi:MAG: hypothetical protein IPM82_18435 [Saprospiraceae bacterium]|nr:hypothetical protein [Saprospiraceae bacterium]